MKKRIIKLINSKEQEVHIDPTIKIASFKINKIYVNPEFFKLPLIEQKVIIYHEKFHKSIIGRFLGFLAMLFSAFFLISLIKLLPIKILDLIIFNTSLLTGIIALLFFWINEILADYNAIRKMGATNTLKTIKKIYSKKKINWFDDYIIHPPLKLRLKIIEMLK